VISLAAIALTVMGDKSTSIPLRILLFFGALAGVVGAAASVWSTFQIDLSSADAVSDHLSGREALLQTEDAGRTSVDAIYPLRVLSLLFRPFFFDANEILGVIVSFENVLLLVAVSMLVFHGSKTRTLVKTVPFTRYALLSSVGVLLVLSLGYYNVGLGIRQKATMILPGLLVLFVALRAILDARKEAGGRGWVLPISPGSARLHEGGSEFAVSAALREHEAATNIAGPAGG
jgi:hypothetical protein